jgi:hypothetical protein
VVLVGSASGAPGGGMTAGVATEVSVLSVLDSEVVVTDSGSLLVCS